MKINSELDPFFKDSALTYGVQEDGSRRDGTIRGIILSTKQVNIGHIFGIEQVAVDAQF